VRVKAAVRRARMSRTAPRRNDYPAVAFSASCKPDASKSRKPRAESRKPRAESRKPKAESLQATVGRSCVDGDSMSTGRWAGGLAVPVGLPSRRGSVAIPTAAPPNHTIRATVRYVRAGPGFARPAEARCSDTAPVESKELAFGALVKFRAVVPRTCARLESALSPVSETVTTKVWPCPVFSPPAGIGPFRPRCRRPRGDLCIGTENRPLFGRLLPPTEGHMSPAGRYC